MDFALSDNLHSWEHKILFVQWKTNSTVLINKPQVDLLIYGFERNSHS